MSDFKKRKADEDEEQISSKSHTKKNRLIEDSTSSFAFTSKSSSSDISNLWNPIDNLNSSFSFTSSNVDYESAYNQTNNHLVTTNDLSTNNNGNYQMIKQGEHEVKRDSSPPINRVTPIKKRVKTEDLSTLPTPPPSGKYSSVASRMMEKMGYDKNRGLGVNSQGPTKLVEESKQKGRRGLGFTFQNFDDQTAEWSFQMDPAPVEEEVEWCPRSDHPEDPLTLDQMLGWIKLDPKKKVIDDEIEFCEEIILKGMLSGKTIFDELPQKEMEEARARSNVYETIGPSIFLNRAAVKMANIDSVFGRIFTEPKTPDEQRSLVQPDEPFYFADVCAGPGGFSEYILWKKQWRAKGFGFTLKGSSDFQLHKFLAGPPETFDAYYGVKDYDGDGDIFKTENIDALKNYVNKCTMHKGVHIVMADGGFSVEGQENIQEILSKQLYLCQFLTALSILRPGGHFVCKLFDLFTPFSIGLIYLMYRAFRQISIHKPVTSRPANSERYIICKSLRSDDIRNPIRAYMYEINILLNKYGMDSEQNDVQSIVPLEILKGNEQFYEYIRNSNNQMGQNQIRNLRKIRAFVSNALLKDDRQNQIRSQCLRYWELPDEPRQKFKKLMCNDVQASLFHQLGNGIENLLFNIPNSFKNSTLDQHQIQSLYDYRCVLSLGDPLLLVSCGRSMVFGIELQNRNKRWFSMEKSGYKIELPPYTLLLAERVQEQVDDGRTNRTRSAIYIIDVYFIANENMLYQNGRPVVFMDRYRALKLFEKAINKPARTDLVPIRISEQLRFEQMDTQFEKLCYSGNLEQIDNEKLWFTNVDVETKPRVSVRGLWMFKFVQHPWTILLSKTRQTKYFHNSTTHESIQTAPGDSSHIAPLRSMIENSFYWDFNLRDDPIQKSRFITLIQEKNRESQSHQANHH